MSEESKPSITLEEIILPKEGQSALEYKQALINAADALPNQTGRKTYASYDKYLLSAAKIVALVWEKGLVSDNVVINPTKPLKENEGVAREIAVGVLRILHSIKNAAKKDLLVDRPAKAIEPEIVKVGRRLLEINPDTFRSLPGGEKAAKILESRDVSPAYKYPEMQSAEFEIARKQIEEISKGIDGTKDMDGLKSLIIKASKEAPENNELKLLKKEVIDAVAQLKNRQQAFQGGRGYV
jgi:hypothetical protein